MKKLATYGTGRSDAAEQFGLVKEAIVSTEMKQYRRALALLSPAMGSRHRQPPPKMFFHGTSGSETSGSQNPVRRMADVLSGGEIRPSYAGAHGQGAYLWNGQPLETYLNRPQSYGVAFPQGGVGPIRQPPDPMPNGPNRKEMTVYHSPATAPAPDEPVPLALPEGKETTVIAPSAALRNPRAEDGRSGLSRLLQLKRNRHIDSAIFHRAEADLRAMRRNSSGDYEGYLEGSGISPTLPELKKQVSAPDTFPLLRAGGAAMAPPVPGEEPITGAEKFMREYARRVPRAQR